MGKEEEEEKIRSVNEVKWLVHHLLSLFPNPNLKQMK
jgi:hypothetical protein